METGQLPTPCWGLRATVVDNDLYVTDGFHHGFINLFLTAILRWDPSTESCQQVGHLQVSKAEHAAIAVPSSIIESECSTMLLK